MSASVFEFSNKENSKIMDIFINLRESNDKLINYPFVLFTLEHIIIGLIKIIVIHDQ